ncbi:MAG: hypothetical protein QOE82_3213, partial [Thermoanaerobaculia bacterium]|nr:hypothetical protein [Thermoanaerobaculia bacterium]
VYGGARRVARFFDDSLAAASVGGGIDLGGKYNSAGNLTQFANIKGVKVNGTSGDFQGQFVVSVNNSSGGMIEIASIGVTGMSVTGAITATGTISGSNVIATYQDVAEWVPASEAMTAGTVVVVNPDSDNGVIPSSHAYDSGVAGVVSAQPGVILGVAGESKEKIATSGRVKVRVDATRAPIRRGDLLVTSDERGMAMKSEPIEVGGRRFHQPGTVIGKALEPLASGRGEILVLLSLQ